MKKMIFTSLIAAFGMVGMNAQQGSFEVGPYLGAPVGDADALSFNTGATFAYYVNIAPKWQLGGMAAVDHFFGKDYHIGNHT